MSGEVKTKQIDTKISNDWDKYVYTGIMCSAQIAFGMTMSMIGPVLVDMKYILNTSMSWISLFPTFISLGYLIGSLIGFLFKYVNRQITITIVLIMMSVASILIPYSPNLWVLYLCAFIVGLGSGLWTNVLNVWLIEIWQQRGDPFLQFSQFMYGIGAIFGPLMDRPYLTGEDDKDPHIRDISMFNVSATVLEEDIDRRSKLKIPFLINGSIIIIFPILLTLMFVIKKYKTPEQDLKENDKNSDKKLFDGKGSQRILMIILICVLIGTYNASDQIFFNFSPTYYQEFHLKLTASTAAEIVSAMAISYTIGRGISTFIAIKLKPQHMIAYHLLISLTAVIIVFTINSLTAIWIGNILIGFGFSAMFPAIFGYIRQYMEITNQIGAIFVFSSGALNFITPFFLGPYIESYPNIFVIIEMIYIIISILTFLITIYVIKKYENKRQKF